uniref:Fatty-acid and retinol-binding protein 1 n=1 Tax=Caenorhabditis japonica TaxID=281687 RepID=A0A8R1DF34_CAEJA
MKFLLSFFLIVALARSAPLADEPPAVKRNEKALTVEAFDGYVGLLRMFKDMLPGDLVSTVDNLNITQKGEVVSFLSDWFQDRIPKPNSTLEIVDLLKQHLPSVYERINTLNTTFYDKFNGLKPESQALLRQWKVKAVALFGDRPAGESAAQNLQLLRDFAGSIRDVDPAIRDDLRTQFPSAVGLTEGLGFTVFTTMVMVVQKILEAASQPAVLSTVQPAECAIPLD